LQAAHTNKKKSQYISISVVIKHMTELTTDNYPENITHVSLDEHSIGSTGFKAIMPANTKITVF